MKHKIPAGFRLVLLLAGLLLLTGCNPPDARELEFSAEVQGRLDAAAGLWENGDDDAAILAYRELITELEQQRGPDGLQVSVPLRALGEIHTQLNGLGEARRLLERADAIQVSVLPPDHPERANTLEALGNLARAEGDLQSARKLLEQSLAIREQALGPAHPDVGSALNRLATVVRNLGDYDAALQLQKRSLEIHETSYGTTDIGLASMLNGMGNILRESGRYEQSLPFYQRALDVFAANSDEAHPNSGIVLGNMALSRAALGDYGDAMELYEQARAVIESTRGHDATALILSNLGDVYRQLGDFASAEQLLLDSLAIKARTVGADHPSNAFSHATLGVVYMQMGRFDEALGEHRRAMEIDIATVGEEHAFVATDLNNIGQVYFEMGEYDTAIAYHERALAIDEQAIGEDHPDIAQDLANLAQLHTLNGDFQRAEPYLTRALTVVSTNPQAKARSVEVFQRASEYYAALGLNEAAIIFGKQAINLTQSIRAGVASLDEQLQDSLLKHEAGRYTALAELLISSGRLLEAQQVLSMLKEDEYFDFIRGDKDDPGSPETTAAVAEFEAPWVERYQEISDQLAGIGIELAALKEQRRNGELTADEQARLEQLQADTRIAREAFQAYLDQLADEFREIGGDRAIAFGQRDLNSLRAMQGTLRRLGNGAVLVNYLITDTHLRILLTTPETQIHRAAAISKSELNKKIFGLRRNLLTPERDPLPLAREVYDLMIAPIKDDLDQAGAKALMVSLDDALRYLPIAALYDGRKYLAESYALSIFTAAARTQLEQPPSSSWSAAALGVTEAVSGFTQLPWVGGEVDAVVKELSDDDEVGVLEGSIRLDSTFTADQFEIALDEQRSVMHLATHFVFKPGTERDSFLLLGDGNKLSLEDIRLGDFNFYDVELLTLSACQTALGGRTRNGREIEGFGALAQNQGAGAVIATLWSVADASTARFMNLFYGIHEATGSTKAEALRQAQVHMIHGTSPAGDAPPDLQHSHPFFWAPFILMGNWL